MKRVAEDSESLGKKQNVASVDTLLHAKNERDWDRVIALGTQLMKIPDSSDLSLVHTVMGIAHFKSKQFHLATESFQSALDHANSEKKKAAAHYNMGLSQDALKNYSFAFHHFQQAEIINFDSNLFYLQWKLFDLSNYTENENKMSYTQKVVQLANTNATADFVSN